MTTYNVSTNGAALRLEFIGTGERQQELLDSLGACANGECACSPEEFTKVESMQVLEGADGIVVEVRTRAGESIDPACVTDCMTEMGVAPAAPEADGCCAEPAESSCCDGGSCC